MSNVTATVVIPTNPVDLKKIKANIRDGVDSLNRIAAEKDLIKEIITAVSEEFDIPKSYVNGMIQREFKGDFEKKSVEFDDFTALYEAVTKS